MAPIATDEDATADKPARNGLRLCLEGDILRRRLQNNHLPKFGRLDPILTLNLSPASKKQTNSESGAPGGIDNPTMETMQDEDGITNTAESIGQFMPCH